MSDVLGSLSSYATGLVGFGGICALTKGVIDLKKPDILDKRVAKAEIVGGSIAILFTILKGSSYLLDSTVFSNKKIVILNEEDFLNSKFSIFNSSTNTQAFLNFIIAGTVVPISFCTTCLCTWVPLIICLSPYNQANQ